MQPTPTTYIPGPGLEAVIDLAIELGRPLLVTGEPGTGKTELANYVAKRQKLGEPIVFNTKTDAEARDLFYTYDAVGHFREASIPGNQKKAIDYISFQALGQAIIDSKDQQSVVLIDEIDKAPRDFPNDLLFEFKEMAFEIKEVSPKETIAKLEGQATVNPKGVVKLSNESNRPIVILTSNSEKNLPDAFLRRVLYHHIQFPDKDRLTQIIEKNAPRNLTLDKRLVSSAIDHFLKIRKDKGLKKAPATAELLAWVHILHLKEAKLEEALKASADTSIKQVVLDSYAMIAKTREDMEKLKSDLGL